MVKPTQIIEENDRELSVIWSDEIETKYTAAQLRRVCPCAGCVNEWTGEKMLNDASITDDLSFSDIAIVGRYALNFHFTDGHETGIYSFRYLRELAQKS